MPEPLSPDDLCLVCNTKRDEHGDKNHQFSLTSDVPIPLKPGEPPRQQAPRERDPNAKPSGVEELEKAFLRLNEVLLEKGVIDGRDLIQILGGPTS